MTPYHRELIGHERQSFMRLYQQIEDKYPLFKWIKSGEYPMSLWLIFVMSFFSLAVFLNCHRKVYANIIEVCIGIICLQVIFIATHMRSHALFLEYDQHIPDSKRLTDPPIYYYAFYHHHHHNKKDNWMPELGYFSEKNSKFLTAYAGARNIISAHWHGFSLLASTRGIILIICMALLNTNTSLFFAGYELGVIVLPFAHIWQHDVPVSYGKMRYIFKFLEYCGIIAGAKDHHKHHAHHLTPTVYQDFCSSGLYFKWLKLDGLINKFWDWAFYKAIQDGLMPYDIIRPYIELVTVFSLVVVPLTLGCRMVF